MSTTPKLKQGACPWHYAVVCVSEMYGLLTEARREISIAAKWSAGTLGTQTQ